METLIYFKYRYRGSELLHSKLFAPTTIAADFLYQSTQHHEINLLDLAVPELDPTCRFPAVRNSDYTSCKTGPLQHLRPHQATTMGPKLITVLISGSGTNLQALIDAIVSQQLQGCRIVRVISNRKSAYGLTRAKDATMQTYYQNLLEYKRKHPDNVDLARQEYDRDLVTALLKDKPDLVVCVSPSKLTSVSF